MSILELFRQRRAEVHAEPWQQYRELLRREIRGETTEGDAGELIRLADTLKLADADVARHIEILRAFDDAKRLADNLPSAKQNLSEAQAAYRKLRDEYNAVVKTWQARLSELHAAQEAAQNEVTRDENASYDLRGLREREPALLAAP